MILQDLISMPHSYLFVEARVAVRSPILPVTEERGKSNANKKECGQPGSSVYAVPPAISSRKRLFTGRRCVASKSSIQTISLSAVVSSTTPSSISMAPSGFFREKRI
jgi:hypothetical protein